MDDEYRDRWITCGHEGLTIRWYYPWGAKRISYASIRSLRRVDLTAPSGKWRIWGSTTTRYWASLDPQRPRKRVGLALGLGRHVHPFITPDDPDAVERAISRHAQLDPSTGLRIGRPIV